MCCMALSNTGIDINKAELVVFGIYTTSDRTPELYSTTKGYVVIRIGYHLG
jgi:hypothetical protein